MSFLLGKSRLCPSKPVQTVPRLELHAASAGAKLYRVVLNELEQEVVIDHSYFYCDNKGVLLLLKNEEKRNPTYVQNRVAMIRDLTCVDDWRYVPSSLNPADIASRGVFPSEKVKIDWFLTGPKFLRTLKSGEVPSAEEIGTDPHQELSCLVAERLDVDCLSPSSPNLIDWIAERSSTWSKVVRVLAYVRRFVVVIKGRAPLHTGFVRRSEFLEAEICAIGLAQNSSGLICAGKARGGLEKLAPFVDEQGLLRVGGRIKSATLLTHDEKHPLIMPNSHRVSESVLLRYHMDNGHASEKDCVNISRHRFWIIAGLAQAKRLVSKCRHCIEERARTATTYHCSFQKSLQTFLA